jgi:Domain of unknown function (DUF4145)
MSNQSHRLLCLTCGEKKFHTIRYQIDQSTAELRDESESDSINTTGESYGYYQIIMCLGCRTISFRQYFESQNSDNEIFGIQLFPERDGENYISPVEFKNLPQKVDKLYQQAIKSFNFKMPILCAAGIRATIEGVCMKHEITGNNLKEKINGLKEKGFISKLEVQRLHLLRFLGNEALHELETPSFDELRSAIKILNHLLEGMYDLEQEANALNLNTALRRRKGTQ